MRRDFWGFLKSRRENQRPIAYILIHQHCHSTLSHQDPFHLRHFTILYRNKPSTFILLQPFNSLMFVKIDRSSSLSFLSGLFTASWSSSVIISSSYFLRCPFSSLSLIDKKRKSLRFLLPFSSPFTPFLLPSSLSASFPISTHYSLSFPKKLRVCVCV